MPRRPIHQYPEEALDKALRAVREENLPIREASRRYNVPRGTIQDRIHNRVAEGPRRMGPATILTDEEEKKLVNWLIALSKCGFARKKNDLLNTVQQILNADNRKTVFKNNRPGNKWYSAFLRRHSELSIRTAEGITKGRAVITEESIRKWFKGLTDYLDAVNAKDILYDPRRIFNGDETSFSMCPKTGKVIAPKGWKNVYDIQCGNEKETITVLLVFTASGDTVAPMVVFPYIRPPKDVIESMPKDWFLGRSDTGWMKSDVFYEYIINGVDRWINEKNIQKPVLLLVDGHRTHLTLHLSNACAERQIILYCLPPNTTHILQPADVSVFKPLKSDWKVTLREWQSEPENINSSLSKRTFCPLLQKVLGNKNLPDTIRNGFRKCGLYPFNPQAVDFSKCVQNNLEQLRENSVYETEELNEKHYEAAIKVIKELRPLLEEKNQDVDVILKTIQTRRHCNHGDVTVEDTANGVEDFGLQAEERVVEGQNVNNREETVGDNKRANTETTELNIEPGVYEVHGTTLMPVSTPSTCGDIFNQIQDTQSSTSSNSPRSPTKLGKRKLIFDDHLFYPEPLPKGGKKNKNRGNSASDFSPPKAVSSMAWREWISQKENMKKERAEAVLRRKEERKRRAIEREQQMRKSTKRRKRSQSTSSEDDEDYFIQCKECGEELVSDVEDDNLKNVGCDDCPNWFHLKCTAFKGMAYTDIENEPFKCKFC